MKYNVILIGEKITFDDDIPNVADFSYDIYGVGTGFITDSFILTHQL